MTPTTDIKLGHVDLAQNESIKELKSRLDKLEKEVSKLHTKHSVTEHNIQQTMSNIGDLKKDIGKFESKLNESLSNLQKDIATSNELIFMTQIENLKEYKSTIWRVTGSIVGSVIVAGVLFFLKM